MTQENDENHDEIAEAVALEEARRDDTRQRHARETKAQIGQMLGVSRETVRQTVIIDQTFTDGRELLVSGKATVNQLYKLAVSDSRAGLYVKIAPELKEAAKDEAMRRGLTLADFIAEAIATQIFG